MENSRYTFSAERQLMFYININGQNLLVQFGSRNNHGVSVYTTSLPTVAEAIRKHSLYKRGVIVEQQKVVSQPTVPEQQEVIKETTATAPNEETIEGETIEAKNFTQAKSLLAKRLDIKYNDIKTPDQLMKLAQEAGIVVKY